PRSAHRRGAGLCRIERIESFVRMATLGIDDRLWTRLGPRPRSCHAELYGGVQACAGEYPGRLRSTAQSSGPRPGTGYLYEPHRRTGGPDFRPAVADMGARARPPGRPIR